MAKLVLIKHPASGLIKNGRFGFSWTYFFFGAFVPAIRGELGVAVLHFVLSIITFGFWQLIVAFLYNKQYMTRMLEKGYVLADSADTNAKARVALGIADSAPAYQSA